MPESADRFPESAPRRCCGSAAASCSTGSRTSLRSRPAFVHDWPRSPASSAGAMAVIEWLAYAFAVGSRRPGHRRDPMVVIVRRFTKHPEDLIVDSVEVQPAVAPAEIEQGIEARLEARLDHLADQNVMVAAFVDRVRSHSNTPSESWRIGAPVSPGDHGVAPKRSSARVEKRIESGCCPVCSTLTAKCRAVSAAALAAALATHTSNNGGSRDTEVKLLTVNPTGSPSSSRQVTTVTPVAKQPNASRKVRGSDPLRYSGGGSRRPWVPAIQAPLTQSPAARPGDREHLGDGPIERRRHQIERLERVMMVRRRHRRSSRRAAAPPPRSRG